MKLAIFAENISEDGDHEEDEGDKGENKKAGYGSGPHGTVVLKEICKTPEYDPHATPCLCFRADSARNCNPTPLKMPQPPSFFKGFVGTELRGPIYGL